MVGTEAWSSVAEVETLRELAHTQARAAAAVRQHADDGAATAGTLEAELITARSAATERRDRANFELDSLLGLAAQAGLQRRTAMLADQLRSGSLAAETWNPLLRELAADWRDVLHRHRELMRELRRAAASAERARADEREAAARVERAATKRTACEQQLEEARAAITTAFARWRSTLSQLDLDEPSAQAALGLAHEGSSALPALSALVDRQRGALSDERSAQVAARATATTAVAATEAEIERLAGAQDRRAARSGLASGQPRRARRGSAVEAGRFPSEFAAAQRSGLEVGLEAAGLLDAWVTPSGRFEDAAIADVVFTGTPPAAGDSLLGVLEPVVSRPVASGVVAELLRSIGLGERETGPWIDVDGRFALGPLHGRAQGSGRACRRRRSRGAAGGPDHRAARASRFA